MKETNQAGGAVHAANGLPLSASFAMQRLWIGNHLLKHGKATTLQLREILGVMHPAGRIKEMRAIGWPIKTIWIWAHDTQGRPHRCGLYVLQRGGVNHG